LGSFNSEYAVETKPHYPRRPPFWHIPFCAAFSLYGFAQALSGLTTGVVLIPSKFEKHYASAALESSTFCWSMALYLITGILFGFGAVSAYRALFGKSTVRPQLPDEPTAQNSQVSPD
jgi:hypothetical protein